MAASISATVGDLQAPSEYIRQIKQVILRTPMTFTRGKDGVAKPCTCIALVGAQGEGKTTMLNNLLSSFHGSPCDLFRAGYGPEATNSTTHCTLIPVHRLWWPEVPEADLPCYFYVWDTRGLADGDATSEGNAALFLDPLLKGELKVGGASISEGVGRNGDLTPAAQAIFYCISANDAIEKIPTRLHLFNKHCQETSRGKNRALGVPLYVVATKAECAVRSVYDPVACTDAYDGIPHNPDVSRLLLNLAKQCKIPFQRLILGFGLNAIHVNGSDNFRDVREAILLRGVLAAVREASACETLNRSPEVAEAAGRDQATVSKSPTSLLYASTEDLQAALNAMKLLDAVDVVKNQNIDGAALFRMTKADVKQVFGKCTYGTRDRILRMVEPYWNLPPSGSAHAKRIIINDLPTTVTSAPKISVFKASRKSQQVANTTGVWLWDAVVPKSSTVALDAHGQTITLAKGTYHMTFRATLSHQSQGNCAITLSLNNTPVSVFRNNDANNQQQSICFADVVEATNDGTVVSYSIAGNFQHVVGDNENHLTIVKLL